MMNNLEARTKAAFNWWNSLQPFRTEDDRYRHPGDRATLARLRRCGTPMEAAAEPATADLFRKLGYRSPECDLARVAALAAVLAGVRDDRESVKLARALGPPRGGKPEDALLKPLRFKRLMGARGAEELLIGFRRAIQILNRKANVKDIAALMLAWDADGLGDRTRVRFAFDYYDSGDYTPDDSR